MWYVLIAVVIFFTIVALVSRNRRRAGATGESSSAAGLDQAMGAAYSMQSVRQSGSSGV